MSNTYLLLWLEGPFQSWGNDSRYGRRESLKFPTKSALCGMICAAMGARGEQREFLDILAQAKITVLSYTKKKSFPPRRLGETIRYIETPLVHTGKIWYTIGKEAISQ